MHLTTYYCTHIRILLCDCVVLAGKVYNLTPYMKFHPGGVDELMRGAGKDCTILFDEVRYQPYIHTAAYIFFASTCVCMGVRMCLVFFLLCMLQHHVDAVRLHALC